MGGIPKYINHRVGAWRTARCRGQGAVSCCIFSDPEGLTRGVDGGEMDGGGGVGGDETDGART